MLDETFDEDRARNRADNAPENLAVLRKLALNMLRNARRDLSISLKRKRVGWSNQIATKPFVWTADPGRITAAVKRAHQNLGSND